MTKTVKFGSAFGTQLNVHYSWLWIAPFIVYTLVTLNLEPLFEAIVTMLLIFASVLLTTLPRIWFAQKQRLGWRSATLFLLGAIIERDYRSHPHQSNRIELAGITVSLLLAATFGTLWYILPSGPLGIEMEVVALFNATLVLLALVTKLSPLHDNLLYALLASTTTKQWPRTMMKLLQTMLLLLFAVGSIFMLRLGWLAFGWWFVIAVMLSQIGRFGRIAR